jgi:AcrR family transcriptional regulator
VPKSDPAHADEMRQRILEGAHRAIHAKGYRGATMPAIAAESGVSVGLLYRYFSSKEELCLAMCEAVTDSQLNELAVQFSQIADPEERLMNGVELFVESLWAEGWGALVVAGWAEADVNPALAELARRRCDQLRAFAAMFIREAIARGEADPELDVDRLSSATAMLLDGVIAHQAEMGDRFEPRAAAEAMTQLLRPALVSRRGGRAPTPA